jgi:hypothetical protein
LYIIAVCVCVCFCIVLHFLVKRSVIATLHINTIANAQVQYSINVRLCNYFLIFFVVVVLVQQLALAMLIRTYAAVCAGASSLLIFACALAICFTCATVAACLWG